MSYFIFDVMPNLFTFNPRTFGNGFGSLGYNIREVKQNPLHTVPAADTTH